MEKVVCGTCVDTDVFKEEGSIYCMYVRMRGTICGYDVISAMTLSVTLSFGCVG